MEPSCGGESVQAQAGRERRVGDDGSSAEEEGGGQTDRLTTPVLIASCRAAMMSRSRLELIGTKSTR